LLCMIGYLAIFGSFYQGFFAKYLWLDIKIPNSGFAQIRDDFNVVAINQ